MGAVVAAVTVTGGYALVVFALSRLARLARRRGAGGAVLGVFDEIWHPAAVAPRIAVEQQHARRLPGHPAGDPPWLAGLGDQAHGPAWTCAVGGNQADPGLDAHNDR